MQAISTAAAGMMAAASRLNASAQRVASADAQAEKTAQSNDVDYVRERTDQIGAATDFKANAAVLKTADEMAGVLLNLKV
jgi:flagellar hook protein FlgE